MKLKLEMCQYDTDTPTQGHPHPHAGILQKMKLKQEAHMPRVAHLSDIATADTQMLCNIFLILSSQLMKRSSFKQFLILKKNIYDMTVNGA